MTEKIWYLCNPDLNTNCRKSICYPKMYSLRLSCRMTDNPDFARRDLCGEPVIWEIHYYEGDRLIRIEPKNRRTEIHDEIAMEAMAEVMSRYFQDGVVDSVIREVRDAITEKRVME